MNMQSGMMAQDEEGDSSSSQGIVIEIVCKSDGTFAVSSEPLQEEAKEENMIGENGEAENANTATSIGDALKLALSLYRENAPTESTAQQQFQSGYWKGKM